MAKWEWKKLRDYFKKTGNHYNDLAVPLGVHWSTVQGWATGRHAPHFKYIGDIQKITGLDLIGGSKEVQ